MQTPQKINAIIIDDEPDAIAQLQQMLIEFTEIVVVETFQNTTNILPLIKNLKPAILFLDIEMPGQTGIEFLKEISQIENPPSVIMVTAYENHMLEAFRNCAFDYLLKPVSRADFKQCIERVIVNIPENEINQDFAKLFAEIKNKIRIPGVYETYFLNKDEILYLKADGRYTDIVLTNAKTIKTATNLGAFMERLSTESFIRIGRSSIINSNYLSKLDHKKKTCHLEAFELEIELPYSKRFMS